MANNMDRFKADLKRLLDEADKLQLALLVQVHGNAKVVKLMEEQGIEKEKLKGLPAFNVTYEGWYSEALAVIRQLLPDRLQDFRAHFEVPKARKKLDAESYRIQDALKGLRITRPPYDEVIVDHSSAISHFQQQYAILAAAGRRFESSLFEMRQLVQADLFDSELDAARELAKNKFLRAAGAIAGVVLEKHLQQVCDDHGVKITKKNPGIGDLSEALKAAGVIDIPQWRHISLLADIRNLCDHNKQKDPSSQQVEDLIDGADKVLRTLV